jgi:outer membrane protein assembly factor BamB
VLLDARGLICVDASQGKTRWRKPLNDPVTWAAYGPMQLVLGTRNSLFAVALETGQTLWQADLNEPDEPTSAAPRFQRLDERVLVLESHQVGSYDIPTGKPVWSFTPPGRFSELWLADADFVVVQTENPLKVLVLETKTGRKVSEQLPAESWSSSPVAVQIPLPSSLKGPLPKIRGFVAAMRNQRIHAFRAYDPQGDPAWTYRGAASYANQPPWFCSREEDLLMLMDGDTLIKLAPDTGQTQWFTQVSPSPLLSPRDGILLDQTLVYAAGSQTLQGLSLKDGRPAWKQRLPEAPAWLLRKAGAFLMAVPYRSENPQSQAIIFQADTGERIQTLNIPSNVTEAAFRPEGSFVVTQEKLMGFGSLAFSSETN